MMMDSLNGTSASRFFQPEQEFGECGVCLCQWVNPLEIFPCRHICCEQCVRDLYACPECSTPIEERRRPNAAILELQKHSKGRCSACGWSGSFEEFSRDHLTCTVGPVNSSNASLTGPSRRGSCVGKGYFLEKSPDGGGGDAVQRNWDIVSHDGPSGNSLMSFVPNYLRPVASPPVAVNGFSRWCETLSCTASDYGLAEDEFCFLRDIWPEFATFSSAHNDLELEWCDACRLLRYLNLPSHPNDVIDLFQMAMQSIEDGSVSFETLCLWNSLHRRDPKSTYNMNEKRYDCLLKYAQIIDYEKTGLFTEMQCKEIGEQMLMRELTELEWQGIRPLVMTRAEEFRRSIPFAYQTSILPEQLVKLPLHEVILLYNKFFDPNKKVSNTSVRNSAVTESLRQRIKRMMMHYNPSAMSVIEATLMEFSGHEETLLTTLLEQYGPEPL